MSSTSHFTAPSPSIRKLAFDVDKVKVMQDPYVQSLDIIILEKSLTTSTDLNHTNISSLANYRCVSSMHG